MRDTTVTKIDSAHSPRGAQRRRYLASGKNVAMRLWENEQPNEQKPEAERDYETVGYVISGRAELALEGQSALPEPFTAVEAAYPPAQVHGRAEA